MKYWAQAVAPGRWEEITFDKFNEFNNAYWMETWGAPYHGTFYELQFNSRYVRLCAAISKPPDDIAELRPHHG